jgi:hypothetical protein
MRDGPRRRAALRYLERASTLVGQASGLQGVVVVADMSPLERILEAFDSYAITDADRYAAREELRWARLFQDFTTFAFAPVDKIGSDTLNKWKPKRNNPVRTLAHELRWLPGTVIDSVLADQHGPVTAPPTAANRFPMSAEAYQLHYRERIILWANAVKPVTEAAAIDYLRANLIEFYQQCWEASSIAERVILDALAHGGYVNMRSALALQSVVRRGLVVLDPAPRLMNRSFGLFILQTERPGTLDEWRARQPKSAWANARLPVAVVLPALVIGLAYAAAVSGQELTAVLSLLAAGAPAVIGLALRKASATA